MRKNYVRKEIFTYVIVFLFVGISIIPLGRSLSAEKYILITGSSDMINVVTNIGSGYIDWTVDGTMGTNDWYISPVNLTCTFDNNSIAHIYYTYDDNGWMEYIEPFTIDNQGEIELLWSAVDYEGNTENFGNLTFRIDYTPPYIDVSVEKIGYMKWLFSATTEDIISGVVSVEFYLDGLFLGNVHSEPFEWIWTGSGNHSVKVIAYDAAGNNANDTTTTPNIYGQSHQSYLLINHHIYNQRNRLLQNQFSLLMYVI